MAASYLQELKPGDKVTYSMRDDWSRVISCKTSTIDRLTNTQFILTDETRFRRDNGWKVGDRRTRLEEPNSPQVVQWLVGEEVSRIHAALHELGRARVHTYDEWSDHLDRLSKVVADGRERMFTAYLARPTKARAAS